MTQDSRGATVIAFHGVQLALPASLPFSYQNNCLVLDFNLGFTGKLTIQPVSKQLVAGSPTCQLARLSQPQSSGLLPAQQPLPEHQPSQPPEFSQGAYPPWMLQTSNPAFCIPDSMGTQSPMHKDRQAAGLPAAQPSISSQQRELQTRNAVALQELMTQAEPSGSDAEDLEMNDTGTSSAHPLDTTGDLSLACNAAQQVVGQRDAPSSSTAPMQTSAATTHTPNPAGLPVENTESGRGARTPAGPQEEFYSPLEHPQPDAAHFADCSTANLQPIVGPSGESMPAAAQAAKAAVTAAPKLASEAAASPAVSSAVTAGNRKAEHSKAKPAAVQAKTPVQGLLSDTKTPANGKHRLMNKSVPPSSKRRKASAGIGALAEASFSWRALDAELTKKAAVPDQRWGGTLTCIEHGKVLLMGGAGQEHQLSDAWLLDLGAPQLCWAASAGAAATPARAWHTAHMLPTEQGRQVVMFGGEHEHQQDENSKPQHEQGKGSEDEDTQVLSDLSLLEPDLSLWVGVSISGSGPLPKRTGHSCTVLPDGRLLLFGGVDERGKYQNDMFVIDVKRLTWYKMAGVVKGAPPKPRAYHTATLMGNRIIVMGGLGTRAWSLKEVYSLHLETWKWSEHTAEVEGEAPSPRYGHAAIGLPDDRHVATFGGSDATDDMFFSSIALLDTLTWRWSTPKVQGLARPCGRSGHGMALTVQADKAVMVVHGGRSKGDVLHNDTWLLELPALEAAV